MRLLPLVAMVALAGCGLSSTPADTLGDPGLSDTGGDPGPDDTPGTPKIATDPADILDLGVAIEGGIAEASFTIVNVGAADLHVTSITFFGAAGFYLQWPCVPTATSTLTIGEWMEVRSQATLIGSADCQDIVIPGNSSFGPVPVQYRASGPDKAVATLILTSNDPGYNATNGDGLHLELRANQGGPCIRVVPAPVDFGTVIVNGSKAVSAVLESCGDHDVAITDLAFSSDTSAIFSLDATALGAFDAATPITLAPGMQSQPFLVTCSPVKITTDAQGALVADTGTLRVTYSSPAEVLKVPMTCLPVKAECAVCDFTIRAGKNGQVVKDGDSISPLYHSDVLYFTDDSFDKMIPGGIKTRLWDVTPATGSATFVPNNAFSPVTYQPNVIDTYTFSLTVTNQGGCSDTCRKVVRVVGTPGCHVELTWNTPSDPDPTDSNGSDMDLHVVHPSATGAELDMTGSPYGYFDGTYDCYSLNANPIWDTQYPADPKYQPHLDRGDEDGAGPENWNYAIPEDGKCYRVGVHYFDDHGFGTSYPTLRVFTNDVVPVYEKTLTRAMNMSDLWDVGRVCCTNPSQPFIEFTKPDSGDPAIVPNYPAPF